jgi:hypothetical protein
LNPLGKLTVAIKPGLCREREHETGGQQRLGFLTPN